MEPKPTPHWRKNQRRVMSLAYSARSSWGRFIAIQLSFPGDCFVQIKQRTADHSPRSHLVQVQLFRRMRWVWRDDFKGGSGILFKQRVLFLPKIDQLLCLSGSRHASGTYSKGVTDTCWVIRP